MASDSYKVRSSLGGALITVATPALFYGGVVPAVFGDGPLIAFFIGSAILAAVVVRALMVSAVIDGAGVTVRNFWRTARVPYSQELLTTDVALRSRC
ncbi:MAG: hypothetical protein ABR507_05470 [Actinomycetota bacterium]|nr:hypothetical protein [Actinomycetota bacterium]